MGGSDPGQKHGLPAEEMDQLAGGREAYDARAWDHAYRCLSLADQTSPLGVDDLMRLAVAAYLTGREQTYLSAVERAHHAYLEGGSLLLAARAAFWLGLRLAIRGDAGAANGWLGRAHRLMQREGRACAEEGYLLLPAAEEQLQAGAADRAYGTSARAAAIGEQFGEADLSACARHLQGRALIQQGDVESGLALLDEAMISVSSGELSPIMTGLIYCSVIGACQEIYAVDRAREWTGALARWCAEQPQLVSFTSTCLVHRAEIMQMSGKWRDAIEEAQRACAVSQGAALHPPATAYYVQAEVHRLRGAFPDAETLYRQASRHGCEPLPGLALLRLAQGRIKVAAAAMERALGTTKGRLARTPLLPACVEIMLASGDLDAARVASEELKESADCFRTPALQAMAAHATGAVALAAGDQQSALIELGRAFRIWQQVDAPYLAARTRELIGLARRGIGDEEGAGLEIAAAREVFEELGTAPDIARMDRSLPLWPDLRRSRLTRRELDVLRLVADGKANKTIAAELGLSEKTVDRHLSNIFDKLDVSSRTAAAAWAYRHKLV